jgi:8-oxo-dGTP pyrophosphatase MutT (NUDIX family)
VSGVRSVTVDRPGPGEELNEGPVVDARPAASAILLRDSAAGPEVLLLQRNPEARFMGGAWVFPGGSVHEADEREGVPGPVAAAMRETEEEAGLLIGDADQLVPFSRWITPAQVKIRFDTHFFLAPLPAGAEPRVDGAECVDLGWFTPQAALAAHREGRLLLVFPTIKHLEQLSSFDSAAALLRHASDKEVLPVEPRVVLSGEHARILLPGDAGYADA